ncbi:ribosome-associated translation inhibitor RaiA [bacterium]|nr:ribosome-associated translation inhibitor RaiA [bacterium]
MIVNITTRHIRLTAQLRNYVHKKVEKINKYLNRAVNTEVVLNIEKHLYVAEIFIQSGGEHIRAKEKAEDVYEAIDKVMDKVVKQLKKYKEKLKEHRKNKRSGRKSSVDSLEEKMRSLNVDLIPKRVKVESMSVEEALSLMDSSEDAFFIFMNSDTDEINMFFRKEQKKYEIIEFQI